MLVLNPLLPGLWAISQALGPGVLLCPSPSKSCQPSCSISSQLLVSSEMILFLRLSSACLSSFPLERNSTLPSRVRKPQTSCFPTLGLYFSHLWKGGKKHLLGFLLTVGYEVPRKLVGWGAVLKSTQAEKWPAESTSGWKDSQVSTSHFLCKVSLPSPPAWPEASGPEGGLCCLSKDSVELLCSPPHLGIGWPVFLAVWIQILEMGALSGTGQGPPLSTPQMRG